MAIKKDKKAKKGKDSADPRTLSPPALAARVRTALGEEKFQVAIDLAKHLQTRLPDDEAKLLLRQAYRGRARQLAAKGMFKEAHVVWENMGKVCGGAEDHDRHIAWLINGGEPVKAAKCLGEAGDGLASSPLAGPILSHLAALIVAGRDDVRLALPPESPLVAHYPPLASALAAYDQGDREATLGHLKQIPFRSPYRDFTYILRGMLEMDSAPDKALESLKRPNQNSPLAPLARVLCASLPADNGGGGTMASLTKQERALWAEMTGLNTRQFRILTDGAQTTPADLLATILALRETLGQEEARRLCLDLLPLYPQGGDAVERQFGRFTEPEKLGVIALYAEHSRERPSNPLPHWQRVVDALKKDKGRDNRLRIALIYRHMAELIERMGELGGDDDITLLWRSLEYDPTDRETYLKIIARRKTNPKARQAAIDKALETFPRDVELLLAAAEAAASRKAFKKAVGLAERILQVDPIHVKANELILEANLSHGRKLAASGKHHLAAKEFATAAARERPGLQSGLPQIVAGIHALTHGEARDGEALLAEGQRRAGAGIQAAFITAVEAARLEIPTRRQKHFLDAMEQAALEPTTPAEVMGLIARMERYTDQSIRVDIQRSRLAQYFQRAVDLPFGREEFDFLCSYLRRQGEYRLLALYAAKGLIRWPGHPLLVYYSILAGQGGSHDGRLTTDEITRLRDAALRAHDEGDWKTAELLINFVDLRVSPPMPPPRIGTASEEQRRTIEEYFAEALAVRAGKPGLARLRQTLFDDDEDDDFDDDDFDDDLFPPFDPNEMLNILRRLTKGGGKKKKRKPPFFPF